MAGKNNNRLVWIDFSEGLEIGFKVIILAKNLAFSTLTDDVRDIQDGH